MVTLRERLFEKGKAALCQVLLVVLRFVESWIQ